MTTAEIQALLNDANCIRCETGATLEEALKILLLNQISGSQPLVYRALFTQTATNDPVVTVLENTIGNIVWSRNAAGRYDGTLVNAFTANKTFCLIQLIWLDIAGSSGSVNPSLMMLQRTGNNTVRLSTADGGSLVEYSDIWATSHIEILVYP